MHALYGFAATTDDIPSDATIYESLDAMFIVLLAIIAVVLITWLIFIRRVTKEMDEEHELEIEEKDDEEQPPL